MLNYHVDRALEVDEREPKLPAWVRDKLETMRRATTEARAELFALKNGGEPGPFWLEGWDDKHRFYLPRNGGRLMFGDPAKENSRLELTAESNFGRAGHLNVSGHGSIAAMPWAANVMTLRAVED